MFPILASLAMTVMLVTAAAPADDSALVSALIAANTQVNRIADITVRRALHLIHGSYLTPLVLYFT